MKAALGQERHSQRDTLYGLVNALTFTAQTLAPDERYSLETLAGRLLENGVPWNGSTRNGSKGSVIGSARNGHDAVIEVVSGTANGASSNPAQSRSRDSAGSGVVLPLSLFPAP